MTQDLTFWILTALAAGRQHGYALIGLVHELSQESVTMKVASLYAALERLQGSGLVEPDGEEVVDGRLRRYFALTEAGGERLRRDVVLMEVGVRAAKERASRLSAFTKGRLA